MSAANQRNHENARRDDTLGKHSRVVYVSNETGQRLPVPQRKLGGYALLVLEALGAAVDELSVTFIEGAAMRELNRKYAGKDGPTDVLAFALRGPLDERLVGDVYICLNSLVSHAREYRVGRKEEAVRLLVHGILHLMGYRDDEDVPRQKMTLLQERLVHILLEGEV